MEADQRIDVTGTIEGIPRWTTAAPRAQCRKQLRPGPRRPRLTGPLIALSALGLVPWPAAQGDEPVQLPPIEVTERYDSLIGIGDSATEGRVGPEQIESRPLLRPGEVVRSRHIGNSLVQGHG